MKGSRSIVVLLMWLTLTQGSFAGTLAQFNFYYGATNVPGEVDVELYDHDKPVTVNNFIRLVQAGAYANGIFHRCEAGPVLHVLQGGGYFVFNPFLTNAIAPPYGNLGGVGNFGTITNEFKVGPFYSNTNGTIAMAKTSDPNSATSQFFFNMANNGSQLDDTNNSGGFTVFGHVVRGTNFLDFFNTLTLNHGIINLTNNYGVNGLFTELPTNKMGTNAPPYVNLVYFTVNILTTQVSVNKTNGARQISWSSISGATNNVEYTTNLTKAWQVLVSTNGNGSPFTVTDPTTNKTGRFYRVHVLF
jgi:cyclophilin family peptidyl-prolyl cis-trans isomerase